MATSKPEVGEGDGTKPQDVETPRRCAEGSCTTHESGGGARGGWNSNSLNGSECSWQVMAARRPIENSLSMLGVRSRFSAGDVTISNTALVGRDGGDPTATARHLSPAQLLVAAEHKKNNQLILFVFCIIFLLEIFVNFDSGVIPAILVTLQKSFGIDGAAAGLLGSLPYIGLVVSSPFVGRGLTTFSPKWFCFITMVVNLFATGLLGLAVQKWMLFLSRLLIGLSQAGFSIYAPVWVDQFAPAEKLTLWMGLAQGGVVVGTMLGCILAGTFDSAAKAGDENSRWRYAVLIQAIGLFLLLVAWLLLPQRFVDINMQQAKASSEKLSVGAREESAMGAPGSGCEEREEEEQTTGVEGAAESPQKEETTTTVNPLHQNPYAVLTEHTQEHIPVPSHDAAVVAKHNSEGTPTRDGELPVTAKEAGLAVAGGVSNDTRATTPAPASDKRSSGRRYSAAGLGKTIWDRLREDAAASNNKETEEGRRWSAITSIAPGEFFSKKSEKRPATAAEGLTVAASEALARDSRPCSKALSDGGEPGNISNKSKRPSKVTRIVVQPLQGQQITETPPSCEGLPQFRKNFVSNLLPLDFIATSPTFARRSSQLHPGPAPGAAAAAAAGLASHGASSCSATSSASSSSIESTRKELLRNYIDADGGARVESATGLGIRSRSFGSMLAAGPRPGTAATVQLKKVQLRKKGSSSEVLRLQGGRGTRAIEEMQASPAGQADFRRAPASVEFLPSPAEDAFSDSATAAPAQQQQQRGQFLLGFVARPTSIVGVAEDTKRKTVSSSSVSGAPMTIPGQQTVTNHNSSVAGGATAAPSSESGNGAAQDVVPGSVAFHTSSTSSLPHETAAKGTGGGAADSGEPAVSPIRSFDVTVAFSGKNAPVSAKPATAGPPDVEGSGRRRSDNSHCSAPMNGEWRRHVEKGLRQGDSIFAEGQVVGGPDTAASKPAVPATISVGNAKGGGGPGLAAGPGPPGGMNEVQYQRIFMTPHASTLAFEAFNWAAGVADPLLLVGRHFSTGGLFSVNASGTSLGVGVAAPSPGVDANGAALHVGRRRRSTTGTGSVFTKGAGKAATAAPAAPVKADITTGQSAEAPTIVGEDSSLSAGPGATQSGQEPFTSRQKAAPKEAMREGDLAEITIFAPTTTSQRQGGGGGAILQQGRQTEQHSRSPASEEPTVRARHNVEMTAISEQASERLPGETSIASTVSHPT